MHLSITSSLLLSIPCASLCAAQSSQTDNNVAVTNETITPLDAYAPYIVPNTSPPITLTFTSFGRSQSISRIEARALIAVAVAGIPLIPPGVVTNASRASRQRPTPYSFTLDYLSLTISNEGDNPHFTNTEALAVAKGLEVWVGGQARKNRISHVGIAQEGRGILGVLVVAVEPERGQTSQAVEVV